MKNKPSRRDFLRMTMNTFGGLCVSCVNMPVPLPTSSSSTNEPPLFETDVSEPTKIYIPSVLNATETTSLPDLNPNPPEQTPRLLFIHHSTGEAWLSDNFAKLGIALKDNNYYVSDTNYGWGPDYPSGNQIGDYTDIGHWYDWFLGPNRDAYLTALYAESEKHCDYSRLVSNPGGENAIILFKSCYPNSAINGSPTDPPTTGDNPLRSENSYSQYMTVGNIKGIYKDLLGYFSSRLDKLFVVITAPPLIESATNISQAANARAVNTWLVNTWLEDYPHKNVAVFDFYNVLTSNAGSTSKNDAGLITGNHHRFWDNSILHITDQGSDFSMYGSGDSHPTVAGDQKASLEFIPLLNIFYNRWKDQ